MKSLYKFASYCFPLSRTLKEGRVIRWACTLGLQMQFPWPFLWQAPTVCTNSLLAPSRNVMPLSIYQRCCISVCVFLTCTPLVLSGVARNNSPNGQRYSFVCIPAKTTLIQGFKLQPLKRGWSGSIKCRLCHPTLTWYAFFVSVSLPFGWDFFFFRDRTEEPCLFVLKKAMRMNTMYAFTCTVFELLFITCFLHRDMVFGRILLQCWPI